VDGLRRRNVGAHAILYLALADRVRIVRLLHQRMDPNRHL
jgi:toxin ParE1/3/4